jgi:hypothetical protein
MPASNNHPTAVTIKAAILGLSLIFLFYPIKHITSREADKGPSIVQFRGNQITFGAVKIIPYEYRETLLRQKKTFQYATLPDSVPVKNGFTGLIKMQQVRSDTVPVAINNKPIFGNDPQHFLPSGDMNYTVPSLTGREVDLDAYLFSKLHKELERLENGSYIIDIKHVVIDEQGAIAYYESNGIKLFMGTNQPKPLINDDVRAAIDRGVVDAINAQLKFVPALKNGKPVPVRLSIGNYQIDVRDHKAMLVQRGGC